MDYKSLELYCLWTIYCDPNGVMFVEDGENRRDGPEGVMITTSIKVIMAIKQLVPATI